MSLSAKIGAFNTGTIQDVTVQVSDVGFQPKAIIFWWSGRTETSDAIGRATWQRGFGFATATENLTVGSINIDASAIIDGGRYLHNASCIVVPDSATSNTLGRASLQSMDVGGFTIYIDRGFPASLRIHYLALGGTDIVNAKAGYFSAPTATGDWDVTDIGFQPDCLLMASPNMTGVPPTGSANRAHLSFMAVGTDGTQAVLACGVGPEGNTTSNSRSYCNNDRAIAMSVDAPSSTSASYEHTFVQWLSDGVRFNAIKTFLDQRILYLALQGLTAKVGTLTTRTDGNDIAVTGLGFTPSAVILASHMQTESSAATMQNDDRMSIGAFTSPTNRGAHATLDETGLDDTEVTTAVEHDAVYINIKNDSTIDGLMDVKSVDSGGFTCVMDDADPSAMFVWYLAIGPTPSASAVKTVQGLDRASIGVLQNLAIADVKSIQGVQ